MIEFQQFKKNCKNFVEKNFNDLHFSIKTLDTNEIGVFLNKEGFVIEKTKYENSVKIYLRKKGKEDILLRSFIIVYGNELEKEYFMKGFNKLYFDTYEELNGIFVFLRILYDRNLKKYFENDFMSKEIKFFFESLDTKDFSLQETQDFLVATFEYSKRIRFSNKGEIYLLNVSNT